MNSSTEVIINLIRKKIEEISFQELLLKDYDSPEFKVWFPSTVNYLQRIFGKESMQVRTFTNIKFDDPNLVYAISRIPIYKNGINEAKLTLETFIQEINDFPELVQQPKFLSGTPFVEKQIIQKARGRTENIIPIKSKNIFIVHGHDDALTLELARTLEKEFGLNAIILKDEPDKGRTIIEKFEDEVNKIGFAFILLTPDDLGMSKEAYDKMITSPNLGLGLNYRARQNVILELGFLAGKIGRNNVCCIYKGNLELPSDIGGVIYKKCDKSIKELYKDIRDELIAAGYDIKK
jgi:predicted nucleotide-binding protein